MTIWFWCPLLRAKDRKAPSVWKARYEWEALRKCQQGQDEVEGHKSLDCSLTDRLERVTGIFRGNCIMRLCSS